MEENMEKNIEVGEYIRTIYYNIEKIVKIYKEDTYDIVETDQNVYELSWLENNILKKSKNIIDLIEVGDYVNGYRVYHMAGHYVSVESLEKYDLCFEEQDIKTIVTREQFKSIQYKLEAEE